MSAQKFSVDSMIAAARAETGLHDFGDDDFYEALFRLIDATNHEADINAIGEQAIKGEYHRYLVNRLRFAADLKRHPEILDEDISDAIVIMGLPRTGSTKLQRLLAADPAVQRLEYWRSFNPAPFPNAVPGEPDPRIAASDLSFKIIDEMMPGFLAGHPMSTHEVDEEILLQVYTFKCLHTCWSRPVPSFQKWMEGQSLRTTFEYTTKLLKYLQWQDGGKRGRPWILKTPLQTGYLDLVVEQYPRGTFVFTHRNLPDVVLSHIRLAESAWRIYSDHVDLKELGRVQLGNLARIMKQHFEQRKALGSKVKILDVPYNAVKDDPFSVIETVLRGAKREFTNEARAAMQNWIDRNPRGHVEKIPRNLGDYGITNADIEIAFADYLREFRELIQ